jgi:hypothetical protein
MIEILDAKKKDLNDKFKTYEKLTTELSEVKLDTGIKKKNRILIEYSKNE